MEFPVRTYQPRHVIQFPFLPNMNFQLSMKGHAKLLYFKYIALISHLHYYEVEEVFAYADGQFQVTDHGIDIIRSYIFSGNKLLTEEANRKLDL